MIVKKMPIVVLASTSLMLIGCESKTKKLDRIDALSNITKSFCQCKDTHCRNVVREEFMEWTGDHLSDLSRAGGLEWNRANEMMERQRECILKPLPIDELAEITSDCLGCDDKGCQAFHRERYEHWSAKHLASLRPDDQELNLIADELSACLTQPVR